MVQRSSFSGGPPSESLPVGVAPLESAFNELSRAHRLAAELSHDKWDFAVEFGVLIEFGLTVTDLRWLVCRGVVEHAVEVTTIDDDQRQFRSTNSLTFEQRTCFVLTEDWAESTNPSTISTIPLIQHPIRPQPIVEQCHPLIVWDANRRELHVNKFLVKRFRWPAKNQETVLAALQEELWSTSGVDDPLPPHPDRDPKQRLRDTIKCLNRFQVHPFIHFRGDGSGERVIWEFTSTAEKEMGTEATSPAVLLKSS